MKKLICILTAVAMLLGAMHVYAITAEINSDAWKENTGKIDVEKMVASGDGVEIESNTVLITKGGDFEVTGKNDNIMIHVKSDDKVKLRLNNAALANEANPVIFFENAKKAFITISKGSENYITDGAEYTVDAKAAIFSNDDLEIKGEGTLYVTSKSSHAIASDDDLKIEEGVIVLTAEAKDGLHANNTVKISGGDIKITSKGDGIQAEEDVVIEGGSIDITTTGEIAKTTGGRFGRDDMQWGNGTNRGEKPQRNQASQGETPESMGERPQMPQGEMPEGMGERPQMPQGEMPEGMGERPQMPQGEKPFDNQNGNFMMPPEEMLPTEATSEAEKEDEQTATKGIKGETNVTVTGGKITINSNDHGIHSAGTIDITNGEIVISSNYGKGISGHGEVNISGGTIKIEKASEGIESKSNLNISGGKLDIKATDDGINAGGTGGRDAVNRNDKNAETGHDLTISGGEIFVDAQGDGIDANGRIIIKGGSIIVEGPTNNGNGALDSGGAIKVDGGLLIALGASGMAEAPDEDSQQPTIKLVTEKTIEQGSQITIKTSKNRVLYTYKTQKTGNSVVFSSPDLKKGESYIVTVGDMSYTVKMTNTVTSAGAVGAGGFGGRRW